ncbi:hypothetical protein ACFP2T_37635 [Plantactinospora solaniradicis]|uniref:Uncharacterized protein n=1 Tax=Plantactinospora solaniradicis TaxID=1723736 RepID=A0ABW1KJB1_9ACTN
MTPIGKKLKALSHNEGVRRVDLYSFLGEDLRALWHIKPFDGPELVRKKVAWQLDRLIKQLPREKHKVVARASFNIHDDPTSWLPDLTDRQEWLSRRKTEPRPSVRTSRRLMNRILADFEASLRASPPPVMPVTSDGAMQETELPDDGEQPSLDSQLDVETPLVPEPGIMPLVRGPRGCLLAVILVCLAAVAIPLLIFVIRAGTADDARNIPSPPVATEPSPTVEATASGKLYDAMQGSKGASVYSDPRGPSGNDGPKVKPWQKVKVSCKLYAPSLPSLDPDGYWYRLASEPWNNAYYAPANTFMNGDKPGENNHHTDWSIPDCPS